MRLEEVPIETEVFVGSLVDACPWSDFVTAYWQKGMFATKIGWPSVMPCVRLSDGAILKRNAQRLGLYLTPNDPRAFIHRLSELAPGLTKEMII